MCACCATLTVLHSGLQNGAQSSNPVPLRPDEATHLDNRLLLMCVRFRVLCVYMCVYVFSLVCPCDGMDALPYCCFLRLLHVNWVQGFGGSYMP